MNGANSILDELTNMGSKLGDLPRSMPFSVPGAYFETFATDTQKVINEVNEPETVPAWGKGLPYKVPTGYFETWPQILFQM